MLLKNLPITSVCLNFNHLSMQRCRLLYVCVCERGGGKLINNLPCFDTLELKVLCDNIYNVPHKTDFFFFHIGLKFLEDVFSASL